MPTLLRIDYKSQYDSDAAASRNDCGPACLAMILNAFGASATTDAVLHHTGATPTGYVSMAQLMQAAETYQLPLDYQANLSLDDLRCLVEAGRPPIALVHYGAFSEHLPGVSTQSSFTGPHFVVVAGYDETHVVVHDPLWHGPRRHEGAFRRWENAIWLQAWGRCHEDCDRQGRCNPDFAALIPNRALPPAARTRVSAETVRRIRARAALHGRPQPALTEPAELDAEANALGRWGERSRPHTVAPGETLWSLAQVYFGDERKYHVLQYFNGLEPDAVLHPGQRLRVPELGEGRRVGK